MTDQNLDLKADALKAVGCKKIFSAHSKISIKTERPRLDKALEQIRKGYVFILMPDP